MSPRALNLDEPRDLGAIVSTAMRVWGSHLVAFLAMSAGVVFVCDLIMGAGLEDLGGRYQANPATSTLLIEGAISVLVTTPLITVMVVHAVLRIGEGRSPAIGEAIARGLDSFAPALLAVLIYVLGVLGGLTLLLVPGIFLYVSWHFAIQAVVVDGSRGLGAVTRSAELVRGGWWRVTGIVVIVYVVIAVLSNTVAAGVASAARAADSQALDLAGRMVVEVFASSFQAVAATLLYFDLRARSQTASGTV